MSDFEGRFRIKRTYGLMSAEEKERIHESSLDILESTGVRVHSATARDALLNAGAEAGTNATDLRLPRGLVESLLKTVPDKIVLAGRTKEFDLPVDGTHLYFTTDGCGVAVWDNEAKTRRRSVLEDVRKTAIMSDWLPYVSIYEPMVVAHDVPEREHVVRGMQVAMENTSKHILTESTSTPEEARAQIEMAAAVVGGVEELKERHYISAMVCTISPLVLDGPATEAAMVWAENHVPIHITSMAASGLTGPVTLAGDLVVCHAETLALACAAQAHSPGAPVLYGAVLSSMDPRTGSYVSGSPESMLLCAGSVEMGKHVGFPISTGGLGAGAKTPGPQASVENTLSAAACGLVGGEIVNGLGVTDFSALLSYEQLMIDHEIAGMTIRLFRGIEVSDETIAADLVKKVGIGGSFLAQRHTLNHLRELYQPLLWDEIVPGLDKPEVDMLLVAKKKADEVLSKHVPAPLDRSVMGELNAVVETFRKG